MIVHIVYSKKGVEPVKSNKDINSDRGPNSKDREY